MDLDETERKNNGDQHGQVGGNENGEKRVNETEYTVDEDRQQRKCDDNEVHEAMVGTYNRSARSTPSSYKLH